MEGGWQPESKALLRVTAKEERLCVWRKEEVRKETPVRNSNF